MTGTEGTVEFEMIDVVKKRTSNREQDILKIKTLVKVIQKSYSFYVTWSKSKEGKWFLVATLGKSSK